MNIKKETVLPLSFSHKFKHIALIALFSFLAAGNIIFTSFFLGELIYTLVHPLSYSSVSVLPLLCLLASLFGVTALGFVSVSISYAYDYIESMKNRYK